MDEAPAQAQDIELASGRLRCVLQPSLGGCIAGLWFDGEPALRSQQVVRSARESANFPLVPFSNRLKQAALHWAGRTYALERNFAPEPHAMHGIGWQRPWSVVRSDARTATLRLQHRGGAGWPFDFDCEQAFEARDGVLRVCLVFTNKAAIAAPAGLGWHPYVVKRPGAVLRFRARGRWDTDGESLPVARVASDGIDAACDTLAVNHAFDGWSSPATIEDDRLQVAISSDLTRLVASTTPTKDFVAVEPVSHVPDSFNRVDPSMGTVVVEPGGTMRAHMTIEVRRRR